MRYNVVARRPEVVVIPASALSDLSLEGVGFLAYILFLSEHKHDQIPDLEESDYLDDCRDRLVSELKDAGYIFEEGEP